MGKFRTIKKEKEVVGIYISAHPLDDLNRKWIFSHNRLSILRDLRPLLNKILNFGGIINDIEHLNKKTEKVGVSLY